MKAIVYCRIDPAKGEDKGRLAAQKREITGWCRAQRWRVAGTYAEETDGARIDRRSGLAKAVAHARKARGVLVVHSLGHVAATVKDTLVIAERLEEGGAALASFVELTNTGTKTGRSAFRRWALR